VKQKCKFAVIRNAWIEEKDGKGHFEKSVSCKCVDYSVCALHELKGNTITKIKSFKSCDKAKTE